MAYGCDSTHRLNLSYASVTALLLLLSRVVSEVAAALYNTLHSFSVSQQLVRWRRRSQRIFQQGMREVRRVHGQQPIAAVPTKHLLKVELGSVIIRPGPATIRRGAVASQLRSGGWVLNIVRACVGAAHTCVGVRVTALGSARAKPQQSLT